MAFIFSYENCEYRGEGNTALIISLKQEEKVLRLLKHDISCKKTKINNVLLQEMQDEISMVKNVMKPLLGNFMVNCPAIVPLQAENIQLFNRIASQKRPCKRLNKCVIEEDTYGLLLPDYCTLPPDLKLFPSRGPVLSIEIKPKPGFLRKDSLLGVNLVKKPILLCHFCSKQVYKMKVESVIPKSSYCPSDLFSGCPIRMLHALKMLIQTPQNNIRIFKDQKPVFSEENKNDLEIVLSDFFKTAKISRENMLCKLIAKILLKTFPRTPEDFVDFSTECELAQCTNAHPGCRHNGECHVLPSCCTLSRILNVQMLDKTDIQTTHSFLNKLNEAKECNNINSIGCYARSEIPPHLGEKEQKENETDYQYASRKVWEFIVALVAKDCSIMLVLKNYIGSADENNLNVITDEFGDKYLFSIAVADLDTKPLSRIEKHYKRTPLWLQACFSLPV